MNERFNQLLKQVEEETNAEYQDESRRKRRLYNEILLPKFAELIVRHCALTAGLMEQQGRTGIGAQLLDNFEIKD